MTADVIREAVEAKMASRRATMASKARIMVREGYTYSSKTDSWERPAGPIFKNYVFRNTCPRTLMNIIRKG